MIKNFSFKSKDFLKTIIFFSYFFINSILISATKILFLNFLEDLKVCIVPPLSEVSAMMIEDVRAV